MKYPKTPYFPFSPSVDREDVREIGFANLSDFLNKPVAITRKMDGSNLLMDSEKVAARNGEFATHPSFNFAKRMHAGIKHLIPEHIAIFGEWLFAQHSIAYKRELALEGLYQPFAAFNKETSQWKGIDGVAFYAKPLGFTPVKVIYNNLKFKTEKELERAITQIGDRIIAEGHEGIVVRSEFGFYNGDFKHNVAKYVRKDHVKTDKHWSKNKIVRNEVKG